jgi:kumamolisin
MKRILILLPFAAGVGSVYGQSIWNGDPNIIVPKSTMVNPGEKPGTPHTHYLIYVGPSKRPRMDDLFPMANFGPALQGGPAGYHPADIHAAYNYPENLGYGAIALVLWNDQPNILNDFNTFSSEFGLPTETSTDRTASTNKVFQVVYATGTQPPPDSDAGGEMSLDTQWSHAMAPNAKIYLVEAASASIPDIMVAEQVAATLPGVHEISNSWGSPGGFSGETTYDSNFTAANILYLASSGDIGGLNSWPAESPNVIAVGGTSLDLVNDSVVSETGWDGSGGGPSPYESIPAFQDSIQNLIGNFRSTPDISSDADPNTGVAVYDSYGLGGWVVFGGTSVASPVCAGMLNGRGYVEANGPAYLTRIYGLKENPTYIRDITSGTAGSYSCEVGWDFVTGNGSTLNLLPPPISNIEFVPNPVSAYPSSSQKISGTPQSLAAVDGNTFRVASINEPGLGEVAGITGTSTASFTGSVQGAKVASAELVINGATPAAAATGIWFYNWTTGNYDYQAALRLGPSATTQTVTVSNLTAYFNSSNQLKFIVRALVPSNFGSTPPPFVLSVDELAVLATPVQQ